MKGQTPITALAALLLLSVCVFAWAQEGPAAGEKATAADDDSGPCQMMADHMKQMQEMMQQMNEQMDQKIKAMNEATGDEKVQAIADLLNQLIAQRKTMFEQMENMHKNMTSHMSMHMAKGMNQAGQESLRTCPMMNMHTSADDAHDKDDANKSEHHNQPRERGHDHHR